VLLGSFGGGSFIARVERCLRNEELSRSLVTQGCIFTCSTFRCLLPPEKLDLVGLPYQTHKRTVPSRFAVLQTVVRYLCWALVDAAAASQFWSSGCTSLCQLAAFCKFVVSCSELSTADLTTCFTWTYCFLNKVKCGAIRKGGGSGSLLYSSSLQPGH
jgi:hypothetical protein